MWVAERTLHGGFIAGCTAAQRNEWQGYIHGKAVHRDWLEAKAVRLALECLYQGLGAEPAAAKAAEELKAAYLREWDQEERLWNEARAWAAAHVREPAPPTEQT